jgi:hypothetical protein
MTTKDTMTQIQTLAIAYAEKLVAYHAAKNTDNIGSDTLARKAYNDLLDAHHTLELVVQVEAYKLETL